MQNFTETKRLVSRRALLAGGSALTTSLILPPSVSAAPVRSAGATKEFRLVAAPGNAHLVGSPHPSTAVWSYNGASPGPELRVMQGDRLRVVLENKLPEETTIHWHGVRVPNEMDGVPHLTQRPVGSGETFIYEFDAVDAGTYWYHPHQRSFEQVGRGLYGALIVEEPEALAVDRDVIWVLDDWRLDQGAQIVGGFRNAMEVGMAGRIGNTVTVNGQVPEVFGVRSGERIRLRLLNAANARIFGLEFKGHEPLIVALDGHPVEPHAPDGGRVVLGPAQRIDLILEFGAEPSQRSSVLDTFYKGLEYKLLDLVYSDEPPLPSATRGPATLPPNPVPDPDLARAERHEIVFGGGMRSSMHSAMLDGRKVTIGEMIRSGMAWAVNGVIASGHIHEPAITLRRGSDCVLTLRNETAWWHPIHLHGHTFRVLSRNGAPTKRREWQDTVLLAPHETAEIAFVADNPGDWMIHCHILEHQAGGMMTTIRVA